MSVVPDALVQIGHDCGGVPYPEADLGDQGEGTGDDRPEVGEGFHHIKERAVDANGRVVVGGLCQDVGLFEADDQAELHAVVGQAAD